MFKKGQILIAIDECNKTLTIGKEYEILGVWKSLVKIIDDNKDTTYINILFIHNYLKLKTTKTMRKATKETVFSFIPTEGTVQVEKSKYLKLLKLGLGISESEDSSSSLKDVVNQLLYKLYQSNCNLAQKREQLSLIDELLSFIEEIETDKEPQEEN